MNANTETKDLHVLLSLRSSELDLTDAWVRGRVSDELLELFKASKDEHVRAFFSSPPTVHSRNSAFRFSLPIDVSVFTETQKALKEAFPEGWEYFFKEGKIYVEHAFCGTREELIDATMPDMDQVFFCASIDSDKSLTDDDLGQLASELANFGKHRPNFLTIADDVYNSICKVFASYATLPSSESHRAEIAFSAFVNKEHIPAVKEFLEYRFPEGIRHITPLALINLRNIAIGRKEDIHSHIIESRELRFREILAESAKSRPRM